MATPGSKWPNGLSRPVSRPDMGQLSLLDTNMYLLSTHKMYYWGIYGKNEGPGNPGPNVEGHATRCRMVGAGSVTTLPAHEGHGDATIYPGDRVWVRLGEVGMAGKQQEIDRRQNSRLAIT